MTAYNSANMVSNDRTKQILIESININQSDGDPIDLGDEQDELDLCVSDDESSPFDQHRVFDSANVPARDKRRSIISQVKEAISDVFTVAQLEEP